MKLTKKEISDIVFETRLWDINPFTRYFADEIAKAIIKCEKMKKDRAKK